MTEEHIDEHLNRKGRTFHFHDKVTYIEHQEIMVQSGATFYNGPKAEPESPYSSFNSPEVIPAERDYAGLGRWLASQKSKGKDYYKEAGNNLSRMCRDLADTVGWEYIDPNILRRHMH